MTRLEVPPRSHAKAAAGAAATAAGASPAGAHRPARRPVRKARAAVASYAALLASAGLVGAGCGDEGSGAPLGPPDAAADLGPVDGGADAGPVADPDCDALDPTACALPWPSNLYLAPDPATATGLRLAFGPTSLARNRAGVHIAPERFAGLDGYGLGVPIIVGLGAIDYGPLPDEWTSLERSVEPGSPTLLLRVTPSGLERVPHFVEPDLNEREGSRVTYLRPAVILAPATRYVVAMRGLRRPDGSPVPPSEAFRALRDGTPSGDPAVEARRARFEEVFGLLSAAGVAREDLVLAWDFVTGSEEGLHGRLDRALELALARAPQGGTLTLDDVERFVPSEDGSGARVDPNIRYTIAGTMRRPMVVERTEDGIGWRIVTGPDGRVALAAEEGTTPLLIQVPHRAVRASGGGEPVGVIVYGHGLFGGQGEILAGHLERLAQTYGYVLAAVPMVGMSSDDVRGVSDALSDLNRGTVLTDGLHQGIVDHHLLVRAARTTLAEALRAVDPDIRIDPSNVTYFGGSQGGIFGQTILATSPDLRRGVLAVPGNNYNTMLQRSVNFAPFETLLRAGYGRPADRVIALAALQLLWDRTDPVSYVGRMLRAPAGAAEPRRALLLVSKGDYQVAVVTNEIAARTFPDALRVMAGYDARLPFGLTETPYPHEGSGLILFDFGNPWPSDRGNLPPMDGLRDPHSRIAEIDEAGGLLDTFLREGRIVDICGGDGCKPR